MNIHRHLNIIDFTIQSIMRRKLKVAGILLVFSLVIFIAGSVVFLSYSFKKEAMTILKNSPSIIVQKMTAGRHELIAASLKDEILRIPGTSEVRPRYWGYYYDSLTKANYTVMASDLSTAGELKMLDGKIPAFDGGYEAAVGRGVEKVRFLGRDSEMSLLDYRGNPMAFKISGVFDSASELMTADLIIISQRAFRELFMMPEGMATDLVVEVKNESEAPVIARKIRERFPSTRPILRNEIIRTYDAVFGWRSGLVLLLFSGALCAFVILAWDKATGLSAEERREIGILKATGWETADVLEMKFWEGLIVSLSSFLAGIIAAYMHVFYFGASIFAPALKGWSVIFPEFRLAPFIDPYQIFSLLLLTVVPYIASTIIPSWKAAVTDPDEVVRG